MKIRHGTPVQGKFRLAMDKPEGPQHMLGYGVREAGKRPGLPAPPLPGNSLEAGLQMGLTSLTGRVLLLQLNQLPSNLLNQNKHTLRPIRP
jgi:hypothetical protein